MTLCNELADFEWLTGDEARALLDELAGDEAALHTSVARLRGALSPSQTHLLLEQVELRRRATAKFTHASQMFFTRLGLEQATDEWVARYKAARFPGHWHVADLCCGVGGDLLALTQRAENVSGRSASVIGIDLNPAIAHFAALNTGASVRTVDVADFDFDGIDAWHIDPDRRPGGHRTTSLEWCQPDGATIDLLLAKSPYAAVKLAPATKVPAEWAERCELEWISRDRECRQLVAWHGHLAQSPGERRATALSSPTGSLAPRTIIGQPNQPTTIVPAPDRYVFDVDAAVVAARLTGALASEHHLNALAAGPTYLTGPHAITDNALGGFEVDDVLPLRTRSLAKHFRACNIGQLEIKKRGVDIDLEQIRRDLKLRGPNAATLLITQIAGRATAILARRISR